MEVTLKKAAALAAALQGVSVAIPQAINAPIFGSPLTSDEVQKAYNEFQSQLALALAIAAAQYALRGIVSNANEGKINGLLTARAAIDRQLTILNGIPFRRNSSDLEAVNAEVLAKRTSGESNPYLKDKGVVYELMTSDTLTPEIRKLKKARILLEDELAKLNFSTIVKIPDDVVAILRELDLV